MAFPSSAAMATAEFIKTTASTNDFHHLIGGHNLEAVAPNCYPAATATVLGGNAGHSVLSLPPSSSSLPGGLLPIATSPCPSSNSTCSSPSQQNYLHHHQHQQQQLRYQLQHHEQQSASGGPISTNEDIKRDFDEATDSGSLTSFPAVVLLDYGESLAAMQSTAAAKPPDNYLENFQSNFPSLDAFLGELGELKVKTSTTTSTTGGHLNVDDDIAEDCSHQYHFGHRGQRPEGYDERSIVNSSPQMEPQQKQTPVEVGSTSGTAVATSMGSVCAGAAAARPKKTSGLKSSNFTIESIMRKH